MVIALNMMDMLKSRGIEIDVQKLEHHLGIPVIPVAASRGRGIKELIDRPTIPAKTRRAPCSPPLTNSAWRNGSTTSTG